MKLCNQEIQNHNRQIWEVSVFQTEGQKIIHPSKMICNMHMQKCQKQQMSARNVNTVKNNTAFH
jgi:hypothetical protein